jgi:hypothetical protein
LSFRSTPPPLVTGATQNALTFKWIVAGEDLTRASISAPACYAARVSSSYSHLTTRAAGEAYSLLAIVLFQQRIASTYSAPATFLCHHTTAYTHAPHARVGIAPSLPGSGAGELFKEL